MASFVQHLHEFRTCRFTWLAAAKEDQSAQLGGTAKTLLAGSQGTDGSNYLGVLRCALVNVRDVTAERRSPTTTG